MEVHLSAGTTLGSMRAGFPGPALERGNYCFRCSVSPPSSCPFLPPQVAQASNFIPTPELFCHLSSIPPPPPPAFAPSFPPTVAVTRPWTSSPESLTWGCREEARRRLHLSPTQTQSSPRPLPSPCKPALGLTATHPPAHPAWTSWGPLQPPQASPLESCTGMSSPSDKNLNWTHGLQACTPALPRVIPEPSLSSGSENCLAHRMIHNAQNPGPNSPGCSTTQQQQK